MKRVLFLISDTGGGHRAAANAIAEGLAALHGDAVQCDIVDVFASLAPWPLNRIPRVYLPLTTHLIWLWKILWRASHRPRLWAAIVRLMLAWNRRRLARLYDHHQPDLVVSVHPLLNHVPVRALRRWQQSTPFATVVTDLRTAPPIWYDAQVDLLIASCPEVAQAAQTAGLAASRIRMLGLPISLRFTQPPLLDPASLRRQLGLSDLPTVLLIGGGEGMGPVVQVAEALAGALAIEPPLPAQLVVICGRNQRLREQLAARSWPMPVCVQGFVSNMPDWMAASDIIVTKAGPGSIAESLAMGLPILLYGFVPGQEEGNVSFVTDGGAGLFEPDPLKLGHRVRQWLAPHNPDLVAIKAASRKLAHPTAALEIAAALSDLAIAPTTRSPKSPEIGQ